MGQIRPLKGNYIDYFGTKSPRLLKKTKKSFDSCFAFLTEPSCTSAEVWTFFPKNESQFRMQKKIASQLLSSIPSQVWLNTLVWNWTATTKVETFYSKLWKALQLQFNSKDWTQNVLILSIKVNVLSMEK